MSRYGPSGNQRANFPFIGTLRREANKIFLINQDLIPSGKPGQQICTALHHLSAGASSLKIPEQTDELCKALATTCRVSGHRTFNTSLTSLPNPTKSVNKKVVANVWPVLVGSSMEVINLLNLRSDPRRRVAIGTCSVVY
jgi:hypothetical protein